MSSLTDKDIEEINAKLTKHNYKELFKGFTDADWDRMNEYHHARAMAMRARLFTGILDARGLQQELGKTDFRKVEHVARLCAKINAPAFAYHGLGTYKGFSYRLRPTLERLKPTDAPTTNDEDPRDRELLPLNILGINWFGDSKVQLGKRKWSRKDTRSDESVDSTGSANTNDDTGFVFCQLGRLEYTENLDKNDPIRGHWQNSGYVVVAVITASGFAADVWLLWDFPLEEEDENLVDTEWGYLPGDNVQRAGALIASKFSDLKPGFELSLPDSTDSACCATQPGELVRAVLDDSQSGKIVVRQYIARKGEVV
ncbi:hypothetical protein N0V90_013525 [Kalmusia sp. IMI 367209]|nr:hypothetical protein N0V90_013525 [Kalmusia sp. IMI 367209]